MFGKRGRPPEDRLLRQREIFDAVAPLIVRDGARRLSMRQAARAACLSIGGLYYYFPTKRDLVLHGLRPEAVLRCCQDFHAQFGHLAYLDPQRYLREGIGLLERHIRLCRPAIQAAVELGTDSFWEVIETLLTSTSFDFEANLQRAAPEMSEQEVHQCGRAVRRVLCAALLDRSISPDELRDELRRLVEGFLSRADHAGQALADAAGSAATSAS